MTPAVRTTFVITRGVTNRVRMPSSKGNPLKRGRSTDKAEKARVRAGRGTRPTGRSTTTAKVYFRKDPKTRGHATAQVCISMPVSDLIALDAECERVQMARSHFIRQAIRHFAEWTKPGRSGPDGG